ncbi:MAG: hypothetical protein ACPGYT_15960, partial [Nitrospirales bacterium]
MQKHRLIIFIILSSLLMAVMAYAQNEWLVGAWELVPEEGSNARDRIEFDAMGQAFSINPLIGSKISGTYKLSESQVNIAYDWNGQKVALVYTY